ncbi:MAG: twitching motility two-component system response regulator PilG [Planctomycetaceae bacterium]|jgi:twitching motility two-component system response regulator PilG
MQNTDSLSRAIHAARAGQPALARFHCQQAAEMQSDDPLVWLWLAWLSDSPTSMYRCLQVAQRDARYSEIAEAGIAFARALCGTETSFDDSPSDATDTSDVALSSPRIGDTHHEDSVANAFAALPESPTSEPNDEPATAYSEAVESASGIDSAPENGPEQRSFEALNELSADVSGDDTVRNAPDVDSETLLHPDTDLFAVAQAMLAETDNGEASNDGGLAAGVSVTNDPWTIRQDDTPSTEVFETPAEPAADEPAADEPAADEPRAEYPIADHSADESSPAWAGSLDSCDDQSEWSAEADEFIPIAESASAVEEEALAEVAAAEILSAEVAEEELTDNAAGLQSDFVNAAHEAHIDVDAEHDSSGDESKVTPTVLVVDDSPTIRKLVQLTLQGCGYKVITAFDGVAAIKEIARHEPSLILLDTNMPRLDGYQLCSLIRKHERTRHIPVVMLSGKDGVFDRIRGKMVGCTSYIVKPFVPEGLIEEVEKYIGENAAAPTF